MTDERNELEAIAAEYVLGTLDDNEYRRVEETLLRDPVFVRMVDNWSQRLAPLADAIEPVEAPARVWQRIDRALEPAVQVMTQPHRATERQSIFSSLAFWRWGTFSMGAAAVAMAVYFIALPLAGITPALIPGLGPVPTGGPQSFVAVLGEGDVSAKMLVTVDFKTRRMTVRPLTQQVAASSDKSLELWLVPESGAPHSLHVWQGAQEVSLEMTAELEHGVRSAKALAISLEPHGGSPTGAPTGPVLYHGAVLNVDH